MLQSSSTGKVSNGVVALASAAILAVYTAGYSRTRAAADMLDTQTEMRRPVALPGTSEAPARQPSPAEPAVRPTVVAELRTTPAPSVANIPTTPAAAPPPPLQVETPVTPAAPAPEEQKPEPPVAAPPPPVSAPPVLVPPAAPAKPVYKDGTYLGWGVSRHGDIQASVVVENGKISATIAQCLTRYSCSIIAMLPPQVAQRQSPEVDYVTGATQSANAFYFAVVDALSKAK